jgi:hypothetical protein
MSRPLVIKVWTGSARPVRCFQCDRPDELTSPDVRVFLEGTWKPLCEACREQTLLGRILRLGMQTSIVLAIEDGTLTAADCAAVGLSPEYQELARLVAHQEAP